MNRMWRRIKMRRPGSTVTGSNLLQTLVTILVAVVVSVAAFEASSASGAWQSSVREEVKYSSALLEDVRHVYADEALLGIELATFDARAQAMAGEAAAAERKAAAGVRDMHAAGPDHLVAGDRYYDPARGYDVPRRLADVRKESSELTNLDPSAAVSDGDQHRRNAEWVVRLTIPLVLLYLVADALLRLRARRRAAQHAQDAAGDDVDLVPRPWSAVRAGRLAATVAFTAWLLVATLPVLHVHYTSDEQRSQAEGARQAITLTTRLSAGTTLSGFQVQTAQRGLVTTTGGLQRRLAAFDMEDGPLASSIRFQGQVDAAAGEHLGTIARYMARRPTRADGLDARTLAALNVSADDNQTALAAQNAAVDRAEAAGTRGNRIALGILLAGLTLSLCALALTGAARGSGVIRAAATAVLVMSILAAGSVVLV